MDLLEKVCGRRFAGEGMTEKWCRLSVREGPSEKVY